jgi:hypothetical protein
MPSRYFTIEKTTISIPKGRYEATKPIDAAKKIATKLLLLTSDPKISFSIRETTKNSQKKIFHYEATKTCYYDNKLLEILDSLSDANYADKQKIIMAAKEFTALKGYLQTRTQLVIAPAKLQMNIIRANKNRIIFEAFMHGSIVHMEIMPE